MACKFYLFLFITAFSILPPSVFGEFDPNFIGE